VSAEIVPQAWVPTTAPASAWLQVHPALGITLMDHLFNRLDGAYPHKWRSAFPDERSVENWRESWAEALDEAAITFEEMRIGLRVVRMRYDWGPSVTEFIKACRPSVDPVLAYHEAMAGLNERSAGRIGEWSHRAVFWAAMQLKAQLRTQPYAHVRAVWEHVLTTQMARNDLPDIHAPSIELPAPGQTRTQPERAREYIAGIHGAKELEAVSGYDSRGWARAVLQRAERGEGVTITMCKMAEQALGLR